MGARLQTIAGDITGQPFSRDLQSPAYAATIAVTPNAGKTIIHPAELTGAVTINLTVTSSSEGDELQLILDADGTQRIATLGTGFVDGGTITVAASKAATWTGVFDGVAFVEVARFVEP